MLRRRLRCQLRYFAVLLTNFHVVRKDRRAYSFFFSLLATQQRWWPLLGLITLLSACSLDGRESTLPPPTGHYEGPITYQGTELRASLDLREVQPGQLQGEVRLADRQELSLPVQQITYQHPRLTVRWATGGATDFTVAFTREGDFLKGKFTADSADADILLVRRGEAEALAYRQQALRYRSGATTLAGTLLIPDDTLLTHPAVVVLQNAPQQSSLALQLLTDLLARRGFMVLLTSGRPAGSTSMNADSLAADVLAAARALGRVAGVDSSRVGVVGAGSGATVVGLAATTDDKDKKAVSFVVALGAPGTSNAARQAEQVARALRQQGASTPEQRLVARTRTQLEQYVQREGRGDTTQLHRNLQKIAPQPWFGVTELPTRIPSRAELGQPQWRELTFDPRIVWEKVRVPVLLLYGAADTTLNAEVSARRLRGAGGGSRRGSVVRVYAAADHQLLLPAGAREGKWQWPRPAPSYVDDLTAWLRQQME